MEDNTRNPEPEEIRDNSEEMSDHEYDGIEELDNPAPRWIMAIFYITIAFAIIYGAYYFWLDVGDDQWEKYDNKSQAHNELYQQESQPVEGGIDLLSDEASLDEGKAIYSEMACFACHGISGEGNAVGPNLTDNAWIMGCDFQTVFDQIKNGNPEKGMTAYKTQLSDTRIQKVTSYVLSLKGTNPPNAKEPQGEECE